MDTESPDKSGQREKSPREIIASLHCRYIIGVQQTLPSSMGIGSVTQDGRPTVHVHRANNTVCTLKNC